MKSVYCILLIKILNLILINQELKNLYFLYFYISKFEVFQYILVNILIYLFKGNLPWENLKAKNKEEKYQKILFLKINYKIEKLCEDLPNCFSVLLTYVRSLQFDEKPNYDFIKRNLNQEFNLSILKNKFDWIIDDDLYISNNDINENLSTASNNKKSEDEKISNLKKI